MTPDSAISSFAFSGSYSYSVTSSAQPKTVSGMNWVGTVAPSG